MQSRASGAEYVIFISTPVQPPPKGGYPAIYLLDANAAFATMVEALTMQSSRPATTGVLPAIIIGIGYPTDLPLDPVRRTHDYTPAVAAALLSPRPDGTSWPPTGGADDFLDFIEADLQPIIRRDFPVDTSRQGLFGHSFGGLFVLHTLFTRPAAFRSYVAGSPSIWFGDRSILNSERAFTAQLSVAPQPLRLMIGVGGLEQTIPAGTPVDSARAAWIARNRMVDNAQDMAARLRELAPHGLDLRYEEFPGENHASVMPALISRALRGALASTAF
jgi:predicted alpha/beta superfamily hydrolase